MAETRRDQAVVRFNAGTAAAKSWCRRRPARCLALGSALTAAGAVVTALAVHGAGVAVGALGVIVAVAGLTALNDRIRIESDKHPLRWLVVGMVGAVTGGVVVSRAYLADSAPAATVGVVMTVLALLPVSSWLRIQGDGGRWWLAVAGPVVIVLGVVLATRSGWRWASVVGALLGLTAFKVGVRRAAEGATGARVATWGGLASTVAGLVVLLLASGGTDVLPAVPGGFLVVLGLMAMSAAWPKLGLRPFSPRWARVFGAAVVVAGGYIAAVTLNTPPGASVALALVVAAVGGAYVWRGEALVVAVLVGAALVWSAEDRVDDVGDDPNPTAAARILALGDSYMSGEGAPTFFRGTNVKGPKENECRRSRTAYPYLVAERMGMGLDFFACSGAKADQLHLRGQAPARSPDEVIGEKPQLGNLAADVSDIGVVLVSIGGNDAQFGDIGRGCVFPGSCDALRDVWLTNLDQIGARITAAYEAVKRRVPGVPVVAIPYPLMLQDHGCDWSRLDEREHEFISEFVVVLDDRVRVAAQKAGVHFFDDGMFAFDGAKICDGDSSADTVMNFVSINPVHGSFVERISPRNWIHGSLHPKPAGHRRTADALTPWLTDLLAGIRSGRVPVNPEADPTASFGFRNVQGSRPELLAEKDRPGDLPCLPGGTRVEPFATRVRLFDEVSPFPVAAAPGFPLCFTAPGGTWVSTIPGPQNSDAMAVDGAVYVRPAKPERGASQQVVFRGPDGRWQLRWVDFCSRDPECPNDLGQFLNNQVGRAVRVSVPPLLVMLLGGWLFAMGTTRRVVKQQDTPR